MLSNTMTHYSTLTLHHDSDNICRIILQRQDNTINRLDHACVTDFAHAMQQLALIKPKGVMIHSAHTSFLAGADFNIFLNTTPETAPELAAMLDTFKQSLRQLETLGCPVVACITGAALGGGWELALACHHRIAVNHPMQLGLPEVSFGLLPGAGGITRTVRLMPVEHAIRALCKGTMYNATDALKHGWIHALADDLDDALAKARDWIHHHPAVSQPWDARGYSPVPLPDQNTINDWRYTLSQQEGGQDPAPLRIFDTALQSLSSSFHESEARETAALVELVLGPISRNKLQLWFAQQALKKGLQRPLLPPTPAIKTVGIVGVGMMGQGICEVAATHGFDIQLSDIDEATALAGKARIETSLARSHKSLDAHPHQHILDRITPCPRCSDCDLIIEAVFEDFDLKTKILATINQPNTAAIIASNTSTLPISQLAQAVAHPDRFIGLHFFSPVPKMPLVEIIRGARTSDETLARAWDFVRQLDKIPIVVNDGCGFFTTRLFATYTAEGLAMLEEGISAERIERAAQHQGFPVGPLAVIDEVSLPLIRSIHQSINTFFLKQNKPALPGHTILDDMIAQGRTGRKANAGFYTYQPHQPKTLWRHLATDIAATQSSTDQEQLAARLWMIQAIEALHCMEEGIIDNIAAANVGSVLGIGFPKWMGGVIQAINHTGLLRFIETADHLTTHVGKRFSVPTTFRTFAKTHTSITDENINQWRLG